MTQSPELAGGAGFTFGDHVVAQYLACLLAEAEGQGLEGRIVCRVALEQRDAGEPLDDIIVDGRDRDGSIARLSLQVKRELRISAAATNSDFRDIVRDAWATLDKADFRVGVDRVGAVTGASVNATKFRDAQLLFQLARASAVPADLRVRFEEGGSASKEQAALLEVFRTISEDLGRPTGLDDLHYLLRHFVLIKVDALHEGADANLRTTDLLRQALVPAERGRAADLTQRLQNLARVGAGHGRSWDAASLRADVATDFRLASLPSLAPDIDRLVAAGRLAAACISDEIGSVAVARPILHSRVTTELQNHRFVAIRGLPGTGKSALLRQRAEQALAEGPALMVKSDRLPTGGWTAFAAQLGLQGPDPVAVLKEIGSIGTPVLFIDGLDRIDKAQRDVIVDLINAIEGSPELCTWRVLATLRDAGLEPVRTWLPAFFERGRFGSVEVKSFDDTEAEELASVRPKLRHLLFGQPAIRELVRRPFFARILDELGSGGDTPRSEIELLTT